MPLETTEADAKTRKTCQHRRKARLVDTTEFTDGWGCSSPCISVTGIPRKNNRRRNQQHTHKQKRMKLTN